MCSECVRVKDLQAKCNVMNTKLLNRGKTAALTDTIQLRFKACNFKVFDYLMEAQGSNSQL